MVKTGYKQTEIGILPDAWDTITFENCFTKQNNQSTTSNFPCNFNFAVSNMNRFNQGIYHG